MPRLSFGGILLRRLIVQLILRLFFRVEVKGWENWKNAGEGVLIAPNYVSFIDPLILAAFLPEKGSLRNRAQAYEKNVSRASSFR